LTEAINEAFILCVTVDFYPAVTHQVDVYLRKAQGDPLPIALSIFDLDVLTYYLHDPFDFAYYLRQRVVLGDYFKADSEMVLLGYHLRHKLFRSGEADKEILDGSFAQLVDANFQVVRGSVPHTDAADKLRTEWKNDDFQKLIDQVKSVAEPRFTDVVFFLYDLAGRGADDLIRVLKQVKAKSLRDHKSHDARLIFEKDRSGITVLCEPMSTALLRTKLLPLAEMGKYKSKADTWLALGCVETSKNLVDAMAFAKYDWKQDKELEKLAAHLHGRLMTVDGRKIGRNEPCPCGEGKKFKHCHGRS
jgi:hypothetical protein